MFISCNDYKILNEPIENAFEVDDLIAPAISVLNKKVFYPFFLLAGEALLPLVIFAYCRSSHR